jgi:hypothetical protein
MKYFYRLFIFALISSGLYGQTTLTNGMLYNFSVGDTIMYTFNTSGMPPMSHTITVLQKSSFVDTVLYQVKDDYYAPPGCMTCTASSGSSSYSFQVTDLNANAEHTSMSNTVCTVVHDTSYANGCGQTVNERYNAFTPSCFEPDMYTSTLVEGVGLFYQKTYGQDPNHSIYCKTLDYYHKVGQAPCSRSGMATGITLYNAMEEVLIFPNPATDDVFISNTFRENLAISIMTPDGKEIYKRQSDEMHISIKQTFAPGIYFVRLTNSNGSASVKKLVIN